jgi:hypothetical protein
MSPSSNDSLLGIVPIAGGQRLALEPLGGRRLVDIAADLLGHLCRSVVVVDARKPDDGALRQQVAAFDRVVIHDPLCPLTPERFLSGVLDRPPERVVVAVRPVVDTMKATRDGAIWKTVDRERFRVLASPVVMPASTLAQVDDLVGSLCDLTQLVHALGGIDAVDLVSAPSQSRRVDDLSGLRLIASADAVGHRVREHG